MKRFYYLSVFTTVLGLLGLFPMDASALIRLPKGKVTGSGNATAKGGNGGNATGKGSVGGNGGSATAKAGNITLPKTGTIINAGNASATGGNGGNAKGKGSKGGNGGDAIAVGGNLVPKVDKIVDPVKKGPKAGGGGGGAAKAGDANAKGGNGGNASGPGSKGGNGGDAIAVSGNGNTVINGNNNTIIGKQVNNNISLSFGGGGFGAGGFGGFGGGVITDSVPIAVGGFGGDGSIQGNAGSATVITTDGSPASARGQDGQDNVGEGEKELVFTRRFVKVKNDTDEPMKVFLQYRGMDDKKWAWFPADPSDAKEALVYDLMPGQEMNLTHKGSKLSASRVRIWGVAEAQNWFDFRDQDLWVVPEMDQRGEHRYLATEMKTFTFVFPRQTKESK